MYRTPTVLILPGWLDSGPQHWQGRWVEKYGDRRVEQSDWATPRRGDWMARLDEVVVDSDGPLALAAHSLGCHLVASWAAHTRHAARICAALLVAPPDVTREDFPPAMSTWRRPVLQPLPFAATLVYSTDDPFGSPEAARALATAWACDDAVSIGPAGHINADSGLGDWPQGRAWLEAAIARGRARQRA